MKSIIRYAFLVFGLATIVFPVSANAKGLTDKISIIGPGVGSPIEIENPEVLDYFNPWRGNFIGVGGPLVAPPPPNIKDPYIVKFFVENDKGELILRYVFYYYLNPSGGTGYIYLPGPGEPYYRINTGTIMRGASDGRWHNALPAWDDVMADTIQESGPGLSVIEGINAPFAGWFLIGSLVTIMVGLIYLYWLRLRHGHAADFIHPFPTRGP